MEMPEIKILKLIGGCGKVYFVEIRNNKIVGKGDAPAKTDEQIEVSKEIYDRLIRLPADFETDAKGNIISVTPVPEPEPEPTPPELTEGQRKIQSLEQSIAELSTMIAVLQTPQA